MEQSQRLLVGGCSLSMIASAYFFEKALVLSLLLASRTALGLFKQLLTLSERPMAVMVLLIAVQVVFELIAKDTKARLADFDNKLVEFIEMRVQCEFIVGYFRAF